MQLKLGSSGLLVRGWQRQMQKRFPSYTLGLDGNPLKIDSYFGYDEQAIQREYQRRTGQPQSGVVSHDDLRKLGVLPTLFSVHGTGQPDPFGIGMPADAARRCEDLYHWQPVGDYPATAVPMNKSADAGERELFRLITDRNITPGPFAMFDYSQGSICGGRIRNRLRDGDLRDRYRDFMGSASWGNPMRPSGHYAGNQDPGGHGIDPTLERGAEAYCLNLAQKGDLYTTCPDGDVGEMERAIFNMVFSRFTGKDSIIEQIGELLSNPTKEGFAAIRAIINGGMFVLRGTGPHVRYHIDIVPGTGETFYEHAINHVRGLAIRRLELM